MGRWRACDHTESSLKPLSKSGDMGGEFVQEMGQAWADT